MAHHNGHSNSGLGRPMQAKTNSFVITRGPKSREPWYHYTETDIPLGRCPPRRAFEIIDKLQRDYPQHFNPRAVYDGKANLFSKNERLPRTLEVNMSSKSSSTRGIVRVTLTLVRKISPDAIEQLMEIGGGSVANTDTSSTTLLQIVVRHGANVRHHFPPSARAFFVNQGARDMRFGLRAYRGFFQSVRPTIGRLLLNVDTVTALLYQPGSLIALAQSYLDKRDVRDLESLTPTELNRLRGFLKGVRVKFSHAKSQRARPISGLVLNGGGYEFEKDGTPTTVGEYFYEVYNQRLRYPRIFGVRIGRDNIFPAELCTVEEGQLYRKKIPAEIAPDFLKFSTQNPADKLRTIEAAMSGAGDQFQYGTSDFMREAGLAVNAQPLRITGRVLPTPSIKYGGSSLEVKEKLGAWNVVHRRFLAPRTIHTWAVVMFYPVPESPLTRFLDTLCTNLNKLGVAVQSRPVIEQGNAHQVARSLDTTARKAANGNKPPTLVLVFLPSSAAEIRREVKHWGDVLRLVPTQCLRSGKWERERGQDQYCNNVALKINGRIGGVNSAVLTTTPDMPTIVPPYTMVIGADIGHPGPGVSNRPSMTSLVASMNADCTEYAAFSSIQEPRREIINDLGPMLEGAIYQFLHKNKGRYPMRIVFFRDGVSEGEYARIAQEEIERIRECLENLVAFQPNGEPDSSGRKAYAPGAIPKVTFIVVGKRHHVRFFPVNRNDEDNSHNCPSGFVVDTDVVSPAYPNFYLQSHSGLHGTSRPGHYIILHNGNELTLHACQRLAFELCHVYASATRSVSIPAPVYYADRVCARAEFHFSSEMRFADSDSGFGSGSEPAFDLEQWKRNFKPVPKSFLNTMYFL